MKYSTKELCLIWLDSFIGLEYKHKAELYKKLNSESKIKDFIQENKGYILEFIGENNYNTLINSANGEYLNFVLEGLNRAGVKAITIDSENYPEELKEIDIPPLVLYTIGNLELLKNKKFSIVGSRKNLPISLKIAEDYADKLCEAGLTLVTGIAEGVDKAVLLAGLKHKKIISVVAGGFNCIYPKTNIDVFNKVCENGLAISESPPDVNPMPYFFPVRNRIIAGLGIGTLVVSGAKKSGTMYTAEFAEEYGKDLFCVPYSIGVKSGEGTNELIKKGALLTDTPNDIIDFYNLEVKESKIELTKEEKEVVAVIREGLTHIEQIALKTKKIAAELLATLSMLEIKGVVVKDGVNSYSIIKDNLEA